MKVFGIRRWVRDASDRYAMHAEMSDGSRTPKLGFQADASGFSARD
jgi:hypothetical protein